MKINVNNNFWQIFAIIIGLAIVLLIGSSCSCNYHLKKVAQKCNKVQFNDTILVHDTLRIPEVSHDTTFYSKPGDTVYIENERIRVKYVRISGDSNYIDAKAKEVYLNRFIKVPYIKTVFKPEECKKEHLDWWDKIFKGIGQGCSLTICMIVLLWLLIQAGKLIWNRLTGR